MTKKKKKKKKKDLRDFQYLEASQPLNNHEYKL